MHIVEFFIENHWEIERPNLKFFMNQNRLVNGHRILLERTNANFDKTIYKFIVPEFLEKNEIIINLSDKRDELITDECDHWVDVKNISIDGVYADWLLYTKTKFNHSMSTKWVNDMKIKGIEIPESFVPGTEIRLNGNMYFNFEHPFWLNKVKEIEKR
jgi:hypothetical protein